MMRLLFSLAAAVAAILDVIRSRDITTVRAAVDAEHNETLERHTRARESIHVLYNKYEYFNIIITLSHIYIYIYIYNYTRFGIHFLNNINHLVHYYLVHNCVLNIVHQIVMAIIYHFWYKFDFK